MANIALCWELGTGAGHLKPLADYARCLKSLGRTNTNVSLITRSLDLVSSIAEFNDLKTLQAPFAHTQDMSINPVNYSGLMALCGYESARQLLPLLKKWIAIFQEGRYDVVIADHSPTALLAARVLDIPVIMTGSGFSVPHPN
jgi:hypothetical protein